MGGAINIRDIIIPTYPTYCFVDADWAQVENRLGAVLSNETFLLDAFERGEDIYKKVYSQMFNIPLKDVTKANRQVGKQLVLGQNYGMSKYGLAEKLSCSLSDAEKYIEQYWKAHPNTAVAKQRMFDFAKQNGYVQTFFGRRRYIKDLDSSDRNERNSAERTVWNTYIQGTALDILKISMVRVNRLLVENGLPARIVLVIHDEIVLEADAAKCDIWEVAQLLKKGMEISIPNPFTGEQVRLPASLEFGWSFGSLTDFETLVSRSPSDSIKSSLMLSSYWKWKDAQAAAAAAAAASAPVVSTPAASPADAVVSSEQDPDDLDSENSDDFVRVSEIDFQVPAVVLTVGSSVVIPPDFFSKYSAAVTSSGWCFYICSGKDTYKSKVRVLPEFSVYLKSCGFSVKELRG